MTDKTSEADVAFIRALAELLRENDLTELEVDRETGKDTRLSVRVSRSAPQVQMQPVQYHAPAAASAPAPVAAPAAAATDAAVSDPAAHPGAVTSPMVGTVYLQAEPGTPAFVKIGDHVEEGQTLLIIEAMKTMNHIPATRAGTVKRILVDDGSPVEFGAALMVIE